MYVTLKRPWRIMPGQYIYISLHRRAGLFESHPYMVAWIQEDPTRLVLLSRRARGFSQRLDRVGGATSASINGPYGGINVHRLGSYDKVLFVAGGLGITAHFLAIQHLLRAHETQTARVRRLTLLWFLETRGMLARISKAQQAHLHTDQFSWAKEYLLALHHMDGQRQIMNMFFFYPTYEDASGRVDGLVEREWESVR